MNSWKKPESELSFTYDTLGTYLRDFDKAFSIEGGYMKDATEQNYDKWCDFIVKNLDYIADDSFYIKNLRILFSFSINCISRVNEAAFKKIIKRVEVLLDSTYKESDDDRALDKLSQGTISYFNEQVELIKNKEHFINEEGLYKDVLNFLYEGDNWEKVVLGLDFSGENTPYVKKKGSQLTNGMIQLDQLPVF